jgi:uncharacterized surface anchored protein
MLSLTNEYFTKCINTYVLLVRCNSSIDQTCRESSVLTLEVSALKKKQVYVQNLLEETSQLQSSGSVTLKPTSSIKTNLKQKRSCINYRFRVRAPPWQVPAILRCFYAPSRNA